MFFLEHSVVLVFYLEANLCVALAIDLLYN